MKTNYTSFYKAVLVAVIFLFGGNTVFASHNFGGEITWECLGTGQYVFKMKVYRDCNGIPQGAYTQLNVYGHPTVCSIPFNPALTTHSDISPSTCFPTCASGGPGTTEEWLFTSNPVTLPGVPPATGWVFAVDDCCRNTIVNQPGGGGITLRSVMYPYNNTSADPCFDSSPFFAERPNTFICIGYPYTYNPTAIDAERDSLIYSWSECLNNPTSGTCTPFYAPAIGWQAPYSLNSQIPGNPTLNSATGEINFFVPLAAGTIGNFASCIKVTAYRCGVKIAEVYRECGFVLSTGCIVVGTAPNNTNEPPIVQAPFIDPNTGLQTSFIDTVVAGDSVWFNFMATDFQSNLPGSKHPGPQIITLTATGDYFGTGYTDATTGCGHPPCATLTPPPPVMDTLATNMQFNWQTSCNLINNIQACTDNIYKTFYFILTAKDNACPANGATVATISITVTGPEIIHSNDSLWISYAGATGYQWYVDGVLIPGATDSLYVIAIPGLFYSCQVATAGGCTLSSRLYYTPVGLPNVALIRSFTIVPNPATDRFVLNIGSSDAKQLPLVFSDIAGRIVFTDKVRLQSGNNALKYSTKGFSKGVYFVRAGEGNDAVVRKMIVQ